MNKLFTKHGLTIIAIPWLIGSLGCGTGEYERRLKNRKQQLSQESVFSQMKPAVAIAGTPFSVRLPPSFEAPPLVEGPNVDARRVQPPVAGIPQAKLTHEGFIVDGEGGRMPFYCYVSVTPGNESPQGRLRQTLNGTFPGSTGSWEAIRCEAPDGVDKEWQKLRATGKQEFYYVDKNGQGDFREMDGLIEIYARKEGEFNVIITWRLPTGIEAHVELNQWAPRVAGSAVSK